MRRIGLLLFLLLATAPALAQLQQTGAGGSHSVGPYSGPVDVITTARTLACYSVRGCYSGNVGGSNVMMNVERSSDSQTCDLLITSTGTMGNTANCSGAANGTAPATFCGAGAGTCGMLIWYEQLGHTVNNLALCGGATTATLVFNAYGTIAGLYFGNGFNYSCYTTTTFNSTGAQPWSISLVGYLPASGPSTQWAADFGTSCCSGFGFNGSGGVVINAGGTSQTVTTTLTALHNMLETFNGASSSINIDGTLNAVATPGTGGLSATFTVGAGNGNNFPFAGIGFELIVINTNLSTGGSGLQAQLCANQATWNQNGAACGD